MKYGKFHKNSLWIIKLNSSSFEGSSDIFIFTKKFLQRIYKEIDIKYVWFLRPHRKCIQNQIFSIILYVKK